MKKLQSVFMVVMFMLSLWGIAMAGEKKEPAAPAKAEKPAFEKSELVTVTATVEAIDHATRMVTLKGPKGNTFTFKAGEEVRNLPQVKKGDQVVAKYYEAIAIEVRKPGEATPGITKEEVAGRAKPGEMPAGLMASQVTITATVKAIDMKKPSVTLQGPEGNTRDITVKDPKKLENVKVGDKVVITYTEALALSVEKAEKK
jgi:Cu/Ag efflux protein CusF